MNDYVTKPVTQDRLAAALQRALSAREGRLAA
jgi:CheY-like chemotaxis protein